MQNTAYHQQTNAITSQVLQDIRTDHSQVLDKVKLTGTNILQSMQISQHHNDNNENMEPELSNETANTVSNI